MTAPVRSGDGSTGRGIQPGLQRFLSEDPIRYAGGIPVTLARPAVLPASAGQLEDKAAALRAAKEEAAPAATGAYCPGGDFPTR